MLRTILLSAMLLVAIGFLVKALAPISLKQDGRPSTADLVHPPTAYGASAPVTAPSEPRR